jgi:predicted nucleotidyltransferase
MPQRITREQDMAQARRDYFDHNLTELSTLNRTLLAAIKSIENAQIPYALIGGVAVKELGRPRVTHDIDIFIRPDDANKTLQVLEENDFHIEKRDPTWLYKAWKEEVLVDLIFKSTGDIYFDDQVRSHVRRIPYLGEYVNAISPEDFIVIKAAAHEENNPHHWHDALAVITQGNLDWEYLYRRAKHSPRRVLSILIYAQSNDIAVPTEIIQKLYRLIFEHPAYVPMIQVHPYKKDRDKNSSLLIHEKESPLYIKGRIMEALTKDDRVAEHDLKIMVTENCIVARGEVNSEDQRNAVEEVIRKISPSIEFKNQISIRVLNLSEGSEVIE